MPQLFTDAAPLTIILSFVFPLTMLASMYSDLREFRIPNSYSIVLAVAYPIAALSSGLGGYAILLSVATGVVVLVVGIALFAFNLFGGGDVKLFAAAALWTGLDALPEFAVYTAILGGILALVLLIYRKLPLPEHLSEGILRKQHAEVGNIPYAIAIGLAGLIVYPQLPLLAA